MRAMRAMRVIVALLAAGVGAGAAVAAVATGRSSGTNLTGPSAGTTVTGTVVSPVSSTPAGTGRATRPPAEWTHPRVRPKVGGVRSAFTVWLTLREAPGHAGVLATDYRLQVSPPLHARASCWPVQPAPVLTGRKGHTVRRRLLTPSAGWCTARYTVTVYLQRGPYCPRPVAGRPPTPCPEFASQDLDVGEARFTVR